MSFFIRNPKGSTLSAFHDLCWLHLNSTNLYFAPCPLHHHSVHFVLLPSGLVMMHHCSPKTPEDLSPMISKHTSVLLDYLAGTSFFKHWTALSLSLPIYLACISNAVSQLFDELLWYWPKFPAFFPAFTIAFFYALSPLQALVSAHCRSSLLAKQLIRYSTTWMVSNTIILPTKHHATATFQHGMPNSRVQLGGQQLSQTTYQQPPHPPASPLF